MKTIEFELPNGQGWSSIDVPEDMPKDQILLKVDELVSNFNNKSKQVESPDKRFSASYKLAREKSPWESAMIAAGREFDALASGSRMLWNKMTGDTAEYNKLVQENNQKNELMQPLRDEHGISTFVGSTLPYVLSSPSIAGGLAKIPGALTPNILKEGLKGGAKEIASFLPQGLQSAGRGVKVADALATQAQNRAFMAPGGQALTSLFRDPLKQGALIGGGLGAIHADDTALEGAISGATGALLGKTLFRPFTKKKTYLTDAQKEIVKEAQDTGYYLLPGQKTGDLILGQLDNRLASNPGVASLFKQRALTNNAVVSESLARDMKLPATPTWNADSLASGYNHIGNVMDQVADRTKVKMDNALWVKLHDAIQEYKRFPGTSDLGQQWYEALLRESGIKLNSKGKPIRWSGKSVKNPKWNLTGGEISGDTYQKINTRLNQQITSNIKDPKGDRALGETLIKIKNILSEGLENGAKESGNVGDIQLLKWSRDAYRKLGLVRDSTDANSGMIDLKALYKNMTKGNTKSKYNAIMNKTYKDSLNGMEKEDIFAKWARIGKLEQEMKTKVDLATAGIAKQILGESPTKMKGIYKWSMAGIGDMDYHTLPAKFRVGTYLNKSGWPAATGAIPVIGAPTYDRLQKIFSRAAMGDQTPEELEQIPFFDPEKTSGLSLWE